MFLVLHRLVTLQERLNLVVGAGASIVGVTTAASFEQTDGSKVATTGKAIAMAMVFG